MRETTNVRYLFSNINPLQFSIALVVFALIVSLNYFMHWDLFSLSYRNAAVGGIMLIHSVMFVSLAFASHSKMQDSFLPVMFFAIFITIFPLSISSKEYIIALSLICFAYYKTYLFPQSGKTKKQIFVASVAVSVAFFYVPASGIYMLLILLAVLFQSPSDIRNYLVPLLGIVTVAIIYSTIQIVFKGADFGTLLQTVDISSLNPNKAGEIKSNTQIFYLVVCFLLMLRPAFSYLRKAFGSSASIGKECSIDICFALVTIAMICFYFNNEQNIIFAIPIFVTFFSKGMLYSKKGLKQLSFWLLPILAIICLFFFK